jgi:hypothetical protein
MIFIVVTKEAHFQNKGLTSWQKDKMGADR